MNKKVLLLSTVLVSSVLAACSSSSGRAPITSVGSGSSLSNSVSSGTSNGGAFSSGGGAITGGYTVVRGDTLYSIAKRSQLSVQEVMQLNNLTNPSQLEVGQQLRLSSGGVVAPISPTPSISKVTPIPASPTVVDSDPRAADASRLSWEWPVRGQLISGFSNSTRGIDISGTIGTPIHAAADGVVSYVGNGLRGLGNLVLITHSNGFITAYAHNSRIVTTNNQRVKKGQKIAELGQSDATSPRLHFEVRRSGNPVNPLSYLPRQ